jgi:hypothetical protein
VGADPSLERADLVRAALALGRVELYPDKDGPDFYFLGHSAALSGRFVLGHPQG